MKISIVTVCFNEEASIEETFKSILNQTYKNWEMVVIDGKSTDNTVNIIEKYKKHIAYFVSEPDSGVYNAMNKGIERATGDFIIFLNANDTFYSRKVLEEVAAVLKKDSEIKFLYGDVDCINEDGSPDRVRHYQNVEKNPRAFFATNCICHQSIFYHRSLFEEIGKYEEDWKIIADYIQNYKCLVEHKVKSYYLPVIISIFKFGGISSNKKYRKKCKEEQKEFIKRFYKEHYRAFILDGFCKKWFGSLYRRIGSPFAIKN